MGNILALLLGKDVLVKLEKCSEAASVYDQAIELNSNFPWNHYKLADVLVKLEDWEGAIAYDQKPIELDPNFARSYYNLAEICLPKNWV